MGAHAPTIHVISSMIFHGGVNHMKNKLDWFDDNWNESEYSLYNLFALNHFSGINDQKKN